MSVAVKYVAACVFYDYVKPLLGFHPGRTRGCINQAFIPRTTPGPGPAGAVARPTNSVALPLPSETESTRGRAAAPRVCSFFCFWLICVLDLVSFLERVNTIRARIAHAASYPYRKAVRHAIWNLETTVTTKRSCVVDVRRPCRRCRQVLLMRSPSEWYHDV